MATATLSGYLASEQTGLSTELNSLADNGWSALGTEVDNSSTKYMMADVEIYLASAAFTGTDSTVEVYLVPTVDGTNYPTWTTGTSDEQENNAYYVGSITTTGTTAVQREVLRSVALPNGKFKWAVRNRGGVAMASSGNTLKWRPWSYASN